jgi:hypothetical protein
VIKAFLTANAAALGGSSGRVYQALEANYKIIDSGNTVDHDYMVSAGGNLKDAISVLPP